MIVSYDMTDVPPFTKGDIRRAGEVLKQYETKLQSARHQLSMAKNKSKVFESDFEKFKIEYENFKIQTYQSKNENTPSVLDEFGGRLTDLEREKNEVQRLRQNIENIIESLEIAIKLVQQWRDLHRLPLNTMQSLFRSIIRREKLAGFKVGQRQKRLVSIVDKLSSDRFHGSLEEMQDIAGIRILTPDMKSLRLMHIALEKSRSKQKIRYQRDYIAKPKPDGYRGIHLIYKTYPPKAPEPIKGMQVELQLRTRLQHYWATAVESVDMFYGEALKTGKGAENWKAFFLLASAAFSLIEHSPLPEVYGDHSEEQIAAWLQDMENETRPFSKLNKILEHASKQDVKVQDHPYHVLIFAKEGSEILPTTVIHCATEQQADYFYNLFEKLQSGFNIGSENLHLFGISPKSNVDVKDVSVQDVVLVSTDKKQLKTLYSNYFLDVQQFIRQLEKFTAAHGHPVKRKTGKTQ